jgi:ketosteroid isomerase-like protein
MSEENVATVRAAYEEFARGNFSWFDEVPDDFEFVTSAENPDAGTYRGQAARRYIQAWIAPFEAFAIEADELIDAGSKVVVALRQRGRTPGSDTPMEEHWWSVATLRDGEVVRVEMFRDRASALGAASLT